ncbi:hypothetical protein CL654_03350 [bacterium]|nr:hypothetical protein [bacterium]
MSLARYYSSTPAQAIIQKITFDTRNKRAIAKLCYTKKTVSQTIPDVNKNWYQMPLEDIKRHFSVDVTKGLTKEEVQKRYEQYGPNKLPQGKKLHAWQLFLRQFLNPLIIILLIAAGLTAWLHEYLDFTVIMLAVLVNVLIGFWQEFKSNQIFEKMNKLVEVRARVIRDGVLQDIDMKELVPGDIISLRTDMKIPADARIIEAQALSVNEALLTGESEAVIKKVEDAEEELSVGDRHNMVHMATIVEKGEGLAIVVATGEDTEIGTIASLTARVEDEQTPLQERLARLGKRIGIGVTFFALIILALGFWEGRSFEEMFTTAVAVAVAAIPEGLPAALSVILAVSATRILKQRGLVKRLVGAETLGSTSVIVTDKTGTLTTGHMKVEHIVCSDDLSAASRAMALASDVVKTQKDGVVHIQGEATDKAKVAYFEEQGGNLEEAKSEFSSCSFIPFNEENKYIAAFYTSPGGEGHVFVSGAPETLLDRSDIPAHKKQEILLQIDEYAKKGFRMIGIAKRSYKKDTLVCDDTEALQKELKELTFLGAAAIRDPIRDDVKQSLETTRHAGVRVIMATGDHIFTARSIGEELGFGTHDNHIINGDEIDALSDEEFRERIKTVEIFSRVSPAHKMRITRALKDNGEVVAMTGDGVNDAPALKDADIGVAIGSGTDITKETADLILLDNSFSIITRAIQEGRIAFENMRKVTVFLLSNSFTEIIIILAGLLMGTAFLPITAVQILWANLVENSFPNFALAFEPGEKGIMKRRPMGKKEAIIDREGLYIIFIVGILADLMLVGVFYYLVNFTSWAPEHIQTLIFALLAANSLFIVFAIKSYHQSIFKTRITDNKYLLGSVFIGLLLLGASIYTPVLQSLLGTVSLSIWEIGFVGLMVAIQVFMIEIVKWHFRRKEYFRLHRGKAVDTIGATLQG